MIMPVRGPARLLVHSRSMTLVLESLGRVPAGGWVAPLARPSAVADASWGLGLTGVLGAEGTSQMGLCLCPLEG